MKVHLTFPTPWEVKDVTVTTGPLIVRPDEPKRWMSQCVTSELPPGVRVRHGSPVDRKTVDGWPFHLIEAEVLRGSKDGSEEVIECRLCALFYFMEHAASALVRTPDRARMEQLTPSLLAILESARPDWRSGEPICLAAAWDLEPLRAQPRARSQLQGLAPARREAALHDALGQLDAALAAAPTAALHLRQGLILLELSRPAEALAAFRLALRLEPDSRAAHYHAGTALCDQGQHEAALREWQAALRTDPRFADAHERIGQALWSLKRYDAALDAFQTALALDPNDLGILRKAIQCLYALGRIDDGIAQRRLLRERIAAGVDPRARLLTEYVYDQFPGDGFFVHALETLRATGPVSSLLTFRAVDAHDRPLPAALLVETSELARGAGTPYIFSVQSRTGLRPLSTARQLPAYPELKAQALHHIGEALRR